MMIVGYNSAEKNFTVTSDEGNSVSVPFGFKDMDTNGNSHTIRESESYLFSIYYKKNLPELDYKKVLINNGPQGGNPIFSGWLLPINMLVTTDAETIALPHINDYVYYAFCYILNQKEVFDQLFTDIELIDILDKMYPDGAILILNKSRVPQNITINQLELSLACYGYFKTASSHINSLVTSKAQNNEITLTPCKEVLNDDGTYVDNYIRDFLGKYAGERNPFFRFFYLYQIVEVLLDKELIVKLQDYIKLLENNQTTIRKYDKFMQNSTESDRFKAIAENAKIKGEQYPDLKIKCNQFISSEQDNLLDPPECIYQVRNHVMHRFRKAIEDETLLFEICEQLEIYLYDILIHYKRPRANV